MRVTIPLQHLSSDVYLGVAPAGKLSPPPCKPHISDGVKAPTGMVGQQLPEATEHRGSAFAMTMCQMTPAALGVPSKV